MVPKSCIHGSKAPVMAALKDCPHCGGSGRVDYDDGEFPPGTNACCCTCGCCRFEVPPGTWLRELPGGYIVAICGSSTGRKPGESGGMSTNSPTLWCRLSRGEESTGWCRTDRGSAIKAREWWLLVETEADIADAWAGCCCDGWSSDSRPTQ